MTLIDTGLLISVEDRFMSNILRETHNREWWQIIKTDPCPFCYRGDLAKGERSAEHINPRGKGGVNMWHNIALACGKCNHAKADTDLLHFMLSPKRKK